MTTPAHTAMNSANQAVAEAIRAALPEGRVVVDRDVVRSYSQDQAAWAPVGGACRGGPGTEHRGRAQGCRGVFATWCPVVARGAGTGLSGGANATDGCVVLSLEAMTDIVRIDPLERLAVVQAGVVNDDLRAAVAAHGLWYPPDPASSPWSTIGGNVATNAGGVCCVKYGVTREYVLELEVVTGSPRSSGSDTGPRRASRAMTSSVCSSDPREPSASSRRSRSGCRSLPNAPITVAGFFPSLTAAGSAVRAVGTAGIVPAALELMDRYCLEAVDAWKRMGLTTGGEVLLLARVDDAEPTGGALADRITQCFRDNGASWAERSTDPDEADALFAARRLAYPALERLGPVVTEDVCVPREHVPAMLARIEALASEHGVHIANIAHAGDGNLHPLIVCPQDADEAYQRRIHTVFEAILDAALSFGERSPASTVSAS